MAINSQMYEGRSENSANGLVTLSSDMLGKHTMHVLKGLQFAFKMVPNTIQKHFPYSVKAHSIRPQSNHRVNFIWKHFSVGISQIVNLCKHAINRCKSFVHHCLWYSFGNHWYRFILCKAVHSSYYVIEIDFCVGRVKRIWYLSPMRAAKVQASLRIRAVSPEPSLLAHTSSESRGTFRQKARSLAPLNGWACAVKICHDGMLEDTNSLDAARVIFKTLQRLQFLH